MEQAGRTRKKAPREKASSSTAVGPEDSSQRVKDIIEETDDIAARDARTETQKALGRRAIIVDPEALLQCAERIKTSNQGRLLDAMGKENDIIMLALWGYIWQWADRIIEKIPDDVGSLYETLELHGVGKYILVKLRGTAKLTRHHLNLYHRANRNENNFNALGLSRHAVPNSTKKER